MKKIQLISLGITAIFVLGFVGTANIAAYGVAPNQTVSKVAVVYSTGGLGDNSFNDAAKAGITAALATHGDSLTVDEACTSGCDVAAISAALLEYGADESYDLVIGIGFSAADGVNTAALQNKTNFMIIDSVVALDNVASVTFKEHEGSFLAGALAAMVTTTKKLGFLGGLDIPLINKFGAGFEHGAKYIDSTITVTVAYSPDPNNPWGDLAGGKQVAETMMDAGADVVYAAAGGTGLGVFDAVSAANNASTDGAKFYGVGVDSNQDGLSEGNVLTSMLKRVDVAVETQIDAVVGGTWAAGVTELGLAEDGVGITDMAFTNDAKTADHDGDGTSNYDEVSALKAEIVAGNIVVVSDYDALNALTFTATPETASAPFPIIASFLAVFSAIGLVRRRN
ncbi:MAG: BMP family lipoprotein [Candidatus Kariarchaeum pelagius]